MERGGKRLVICCDGTWNEPDQEVHDNPADETEPTNVLKVVRGLAPVDDEQFPQVVYYDTGVGTQGMAGALGAPTPILGRLTRKRVSFHNTQLGDNVWLVAMRTRRSESIRRISCRTAKR